jgi:hypothetical protein
VNGYFVQICDDNLENVTVNASRLGVRHLEYLDQTELLRAGDGFACLLISITALGETIIVEVASRFQGGFQPHPLGICGIQAISEGL